MKILNILNSLELSGAEQMLLDTFVDLKKKNYLNEVLITNRFKGKAFKIFSKKKIKINQIIFSNYFFIKYIINIFNLTKLFFLIKKNSYDRIIIHTEKNFFYYAFVCRLFLNVKTHRFIHSNFNYNFPLNIRRKLIVTLSNIIGINFISVSDCVKKNELRKYNNKTKLLLNFVNRRKIKLNIKNNKYCKIITVGNCSNVKQHNLLVQALSLLPQNVKWRYLHFGKEETYKPEQELAKKLKIFNKCKFYGPNHKWDQFVDRNSIFINCSSREGLGNATVEAMFLGCIPIISNVPGNRTIKKYIKDVIVFNNSLNDLKEKILNLINLKEKEKNILSKKINFDANKIFDKKKYIKKYQDII